MIGALAGGVGAAKLLAGLVTVTDDVTAVVNTADDLVLHGLVICPDLDTVTYTLAGLDNTETGWGRAGETWRVMDALDQLGGEAWFRLGDLDLATHLYRTQRLADGATLTEVTAELTARFAVPARLVPMTDDAVRTRVTLATRDGEGPGDGEEIGFQEYFVGRRHDVAIAGVRFDGADDARPGPEVLGVLAGAERIIVCPSNPIVSIGPVLAVPGIREALGRAT